jgi:hypothetical protein
MSPYQTTNKYKRCCNILGTLLVNGMSIVQKLSKFFYSPTDTQVNCLKNNFKIYIKTAPTCLGAVTPSSGSALLVLAAATVVKITN